MAPEHRPDEHLPHGARVRLSPEQRRLWTNSKSGRAGPPRHGLAIELPEISDDQAVRAMARCARAWPSLRSALAFDPRSPTPFLRVGDSDLVELRPALPWTPGCLDDLLAGAEGEPAITLQRRTADSAPGCWLLAADALRLDMGALQDLAQDWAAGLGVAAKTGIPSASSPFAQSALPYWIDQWRSVREANAAAAIGGSDTAEAPRYGRIVRPADAALTEAARVHGVAADDLLLSAWVVAMRRMTGQGSFAIGVGVRCAIRPDDALAPSHRVLPLKIVIERDTPLREVVRQVTAARAMHGKLEPAFDWDDLPDDDARRSVMPYLFDAHDFRSWPDGASVRDACAGGEPHVARLTLCRFEAFDRVDLSYDAARLPAPRAAQLLEITLACIARFADSANAPWNRIRTFDEARSIDLVRSGNGPCTVTSDGQDALAGPAAVICEQTDRGETAPSAHGDVWGMAGRRSRFLRQDVDGGGEPPVVVLDLGLSIDLVVNVLACLRAGIPFALLDGTWPRERKAEAIARIGAARVVHADAAGLDYAGVRALDAGELPSRDPNVTDDAATPAVAGSQPAYVLFTSGSTGKPKAVAVTRAALWNQLRWLARTIGITREDRVLARTAPGFDAGIWELLLPAYAGCTLVMGSTTDAADPAAISGIVARQEVSVLQVTPALLTRLLADPVFCPGASLRAVVCGGDRLTVDLVDRFRDRLPHTRLFNAYGPTECCIQVAIADVTHWRGNPGEYAIVGHAMNNAGMHVFDEGLDPSPDGCVGELYISGVPLALGYVGDPAATAERFVCHPWPASGGERMYRTGDLARRTSTGDVQVVGRVDRQVKVNGYRLELGEIESRLSAMPGLRGAVAMALTDDTGSGHLAVVLAADPGGPDVVPAARSMMEATMPAPAQPSRYIVVGELPMTARGKVDLQRLADVVSSQRASPVVAPRTATEIVIADVWKQVLNRSELGVHDDFFAVGGHSLLFAQMVIRLREQLGVHVTLKAVFEHPSIEALARHVDGKRA